MKINPFEIGKMVNNAIKNKDRYKARVDELKAGPLKGESGQATAIYNIDNNRISAIEFDGVDETVLAQIKDAVNEAFDKADSVWTEFEK